MTARKTREAPPAAAWATDGLPPGMGPDAATTWPRSAEAARLLGVSPKTIRRRVKAGDLHEYKVAGITRFNPAELAELARPIQRPLARTARPVIPAAVRARLEKIYGPMNR